MTKIEEILNNNLYLSRVVTDSLPNEREYILNAMKEYAIYCCQLQKEICAKMAIDMAAFDFEISERGQEDIKDEILHSPTPEELR